MEAFATNPKAYSDDHYESLRQALRRDNESRYPEEALWMEQLKVARVAYAFALASGKKDLEAGVDAVNARKSVRSKLGSDENECKVDAQVVELAFLCLQFVALSDVFTSLNIPDEPFLADVMQSLLPDPVISKINDLNKLGSQGIPPLVPPVVCPPLAEILDDKVVVDPAPLKGARIPLRSYEINMNNDRDKGLTVGGVQVGVYGWSFGLHFPGSLPYALMLHPELSRYEAPYSLPVLFNEDEWRNGTQTGGYVSRLLKELVFQKIYRTTRTRYGVEHHTMFLVNCYLDRYGVGRPPRPPMSPSQEADARDRALKHAERALLLYLTMRKHQWSVQ